MLTLAWRKPAPIAWALPSAICMGTIPRQTQQNRLPHLMSMLPMSPPPRSTPATPRETLDQISADFAFLDDWEDRYRYVIELGRTLEPLSEAAHNDTNKVRGCASQVWLATTVEGSPGVKVAPELRYF